MIKKIGSGFLITEFVSVLLFSDYNLGELSIRSVEFEIFNL